MNLEEQEQDFIQKWLGTQIKKATKSLYLCAMRSYLEYTQSSPKRLVDEAIEDMVKDSRQRTNIVRERLQGFYSYLLSEYPRKSRGNGEHTVIGKGMSSTLAKTYISIIRGFYSTYDIHVKLQGRNALPKSMVQNKRIILTPIQVKSLVDMAKTYRDKASIIMMFQSGMDASTLCSLKYSQVEEGLANNDYPLKIELRRLKTEIDYYTFLGRDGIELLKSYIDEMKKQKVTFSSDTLLFRDMRPHNLASMMRTLAEKCGLIEKNAQYNTVGCHSLRESFGSILFNAGVSETMVDFLLGHSIDSMKRAYDSINTESLKQIYLNKEELLSIY